MARRRVIHEEEEKEEKKSKPAFKPSKFDETEFLQTENKSAKMIYISLAMAILAGITSFLVMRLFYDIFNSSSYNTVPIIVPFIFAPITLWVFGKFGINIKELEWKKYLENGFMFALGWFAVWMISMNPPFSDFSDPHIEDPVLQIDTDDGQRVTYIITDTETIMFDGEVEKGYASPYDLPGVNSVEIFIPITDNYDLEEVDIELSEKVDGQWVKIVNEDENGIFKGWNDSFDPEGNITDRISKEWIQREKEVWEGHLYSIRFDFTDLDNKTYDPEDGIELRISIKAYDSKDNESTKQFHLKIDPDK